MSGVGVTADRPDAPPPVTPEPQIARPTRSLGHLPALDGVRGLAVAAVLVFHGGFLSGGFLSVDLFFVLSGFLITSLLLIEIDKTHRIALGNFWLRRAKRLLPALFAMILGVSLYAWLFAARTEFNRIRGDAISTLFYYANWHAILSGRGYWELFQNPSPLEHAWSLAIEEQFYLVWPLVVGLLAFVVARLARRTPRVEQIAPPLLATCMVGAIASPVLMAVLFTPGTDPSKIYVRTDTRVGTILIGAALATWTIWRGPVANRLARLALEVGAIIGVIGMLVAWSMVDGQMNIVYRGGFLLFDLAAVALIAACAHPHRMVVARVFAWRPLTALGLISYGLYLWHWPVYVTLTPDRTGLDGHALLLVRIAVSLCFGIASYFLVERPIRHSTLSARTVLTVTPIAAVACVAVVLVATAGGLALPDAGRQFVARSTIPDTRTLAAAQETGAGATSRTLIVGDSVGVNIGTAAANLVRGSDDAVVAGAIAGCVLTSGTDGYQATSHGNTFVVPEVHECTRGWHAIDKAFRPDTVVIVYGTGASFLDVSLAGRWATPCDPAYATWYGERLRQIIVTMQDAGATRVRLLRLPVPTADFLSGDAGQRVACVNTVHQRVAETVPGVTVLDLAGAVCPAGVCPENLDGARMRTDGLHFDEGPPANHVAQWILDQLRAERG